MRSAPFDRARRAFVMASGAAGTIALVSPALFAGPPPGQPARRVIIAGGALAEIVYALGDASRVVATDITCTYPPAVARLPKIGYQRTLSAEGILALRPDLLLASAESGPPGVLEQIKATGVAVVMLGEEHDAASVAGKIVGVASALGDGDRGTRVLARFRREWEDAQARIAAAPLARRGETRRVAFVLDQGGGQAMVAGQSTAADAMIRFSGAANAMQGFHGYRPLSPEALVAAAPDVVLTTDDTQRMGGGHDALLSSPGFAQTPAGRARRLATMDTLLLLGFGPRLPQAVLQLHQRLRDA